jgi:uncharacterized protein (DUF488 family)
MKESNNLLVLTIGHSAHAYDRFQSLLRQAGVTAIADVRTIPYSRRFPHFNRDRLRDALARDGIAYAFLGKELGGRPADRRLYCEGVADYERMAATEEFNRGLCRVLNGARTYRMALMCSEQDPLDCHRCLLVGQALAQRGVTVKHILADGRLITQAKIDERLLGISGRGEGDLFTPRQENLVAAYRTRARKIAFCGA